MPFIPTHALCPSYIILTAFSNQPSSSYSHKTCHSSSLFIVLDVFCKSTNLQQVFLLTLICLSSTVKSKNLICTFFPAYSHCIQENNHAIPIVMWHTYSLPTHVTYRKSDRHSISKSQAYFKRSLFRPSMPAAMSRHKNCKHGQESQICPNCL